jgi:hypothetical protein
LNLSQAHHSIKPLPELIGAPQTIPAYLLAGRVKGDAFEVQSILAAAAGKPSYSAGGVNV